SSLYASKVYQKLLKEHHMVCSVSRKGHYWDNAPTERLFCSLKRAWLTGNIYTTR
ncbi:MAG: putative transposase, partial [Candidatus Azotimanducaceae bacterium]